MGTNPSRAMSPVGAKPPVFRETSTKRELVVLVMRLGNPIEPHVRAVLGAFVVYRPGCATVNSRAGDSVILCVTGAIGHRFPGEAVMDRGVRTVTLAPHLDRAATNRYHGRLESATGRRSPEHRCPWHSRRSKRPRAPTRATATSLPPHEL